MTTHTNTTWMERSNVGLYALVALVSILVWQAVTVIYNIYFHPLRRFPGPLLRKASGLPWAIQHSIGVQAQRTQELHDQYGPVVRIGPNHLSFTDAKAWKDIYGHRIGGDTRSSEMAKSTEFVHSIRSIPTSIISAGRDEHSLLRRALSNGFSDASMRQQEPEIVKYVDLLIKRLRQECEQGAKKLNIEAWYNWTTFDVVGSLVFGQSFKCLESVEYHPWIEFILKSVRMGGVIVAMSYVGLGELVQILPKMGGFGVIGRLRGYTNQMVASRLAMEKSREDLFEGLVKKQSEWNMSFEKLSANALILVLAGSETTATTLSGATYLLLTHPDVLEKLKREVRSAFKDESEISINTVGNLTYMLAILNEALRLYPPVTANLVRVVPKGGAQIAGHYVPEGTLVEVQQWSANHSKDNWVDPWEFKPERFLSSSEEALQAGNKLESLQAFSTGPRNCIGRNLAYAEMRIILARIVFEFDLKLADTYDNWIDRQKAYTLWDRIPLDVYLTPVRQAKA
ncbi:isotrichodermin C-15 hydroxylase [Xylariaceae sp. FL1651]|nr:isotrichodermin C-15 hydroxylase [Xylariaceae sp. FL1651]